MVNRKAVDVTAHRRAWISRAGVVVALAASAVFALPATPALAEDPDVTITQLGNGTLTAGQSTNLSFAVKNNNGGVLGGETSFNINVTTNGELQCQGNCDFTDTIGLGQTKTYSVTLRGGNVAAGQSRSASVQIVAEVDGDRDSASRNLTVRGPQAPPEAQTVAEVSGRVTNEATGEGVSGASVRLRDGQGRDHTATTSSSGNYKFTGSASRPIAPGELEIRATKDGVNDSRRVSAGAGARLSNQTIQLTLPVEPSATPEATEEATEEAPVEGEETEAPGESGQPEQNDAANEGGSGMGSWVLILAGGLLVALGVGAIVLLLMRRKESDEEDEDGPDGAGPRGGPPAGRGGGYPGDNDETRIASRAGSGADPTMVNRSSIADAPTMMHNTPLVEEFPDPYGAPLPGPQSQGYGGGQDWDGNGYGDRPGSGAGAGAYGNAPGSGAGYGNAPGSGAGGYGNAPGSGAGYGAPVSGAGYRDGPGGYEERFDEPTGRYTGRGAEADYAPAADPYETGSYRPSSGGGGHGGYEAEQQPYGQDNGGYDGGAYGAGRGYDEPRTGGGYDRGDDVYGAGDDGYETRVGGYGQQGYDEAAGRGGYDQPATGGGYDQRRAGYDAQNGYDASNGYDDRGYDQQGGGGGYYDDPPPAGGGHSRSGAPQQSSRSERRSLDWLDD